MRLRECGHASGSRRPRRGSRIFVSCPRKASCAGTEQYHNSGTGAYPENSAEDAMSVQPSYSRSQTIPEKARPAAPAKGAWLTVGLLFLFMVINFADKAVIGIAAVPLMDELHLSPREFGLLGSSFYLLFAVSAIVTGFIVNRVETRWALLLMGLVWALTQFPMLGAVGFATVMASRIALGAGEGPAYPVAQRGALLAIGTAIGTSAGFAGAFCDGQHYRD